MFRAPPGKRAAVIRAQYARDTATVGAGFTHDDWAKRVVVAKRVDSYDRVERPCVVNAPEVNAGTAELPVEETQHDR